MPMIEEIKETDTELVRRPTPAASTPSPGGSCPDQSHSSMEDSDKSDLEDNKFPDEEKKVLIEIVDDKSNTFMEIIVYPNLAYLYLIIWIKSSRKHVAYILPFFY